MAFVIEHLNRFRLKLDRNMENKFSVSFRKHMDKRTELVYFVFS